MERQNRPETRSTQYLLPRNDPDRIQVTFDDHRLVANAGLLLPVTLALRLGLPQLVDRHLDLGTAPGRANPGDKLMTLVLMTLVASALAGGDVLRTGGTASAIGCVVKAPSTRGTFLRSFRWGHVRQLDRVGRELLSWAWAAGAGPRSSNNHGPLTIDLDPTICETYGLSKEGARHHGYTGQRGYHPLLAIAAGTGDVLMSRLREGRANTVRRANSLGICPSAGPGKTSSVAPGHGCAQFHSQPDGTAAVNADGDLSHSPDYPTAAQTCAKLVPERLLLHATLTISPSIATACRHHRSCVATSRRPHPHLLESGRPRSPSLAHHPWCQRHGPSLRWIRG